MNSKTMILECLDCKETYLADDPCDGYNCPKCNGMVIGVGSLEGVEESIEEMTNIVNKAKHNGLIRKYKSNISLGQAIKRFRQNKSITQVELGEAINKTESTIRKYESDIIEPPLSVLYNISKALGVSLNELISQTIFSGTNKVNKAKRNGLIRKDDDIKVTRTLYADNEEFATVTINFNAEEFLKDLSDELSKVIEEYKKNIGDYIQHSYE